MEKLVYRGQIYYAILPDKGESTQIGARPVIIVSNNIGNEHSPVVTVVPITTREKHSLPTHFHFTLPKVYGTALCEQVQTIGKELIGNYAGCLTRHYMGLLDTALSKVFNLDGSLGDKLPPEEGRIVQQQIEKCQSIQEKYLQEIKLLQKMIGYQETIENSKKLEINDSEQMISDCLPSLSVFEQSLSKKKYIKRTPEQIKSFIKKWQDPNTSKEEVAKEFGFSSKVTAGTFYKRHIK